MRALALFALFAATASAAPYRVLLKLEARPPASATEEEATGCCQPRGPRHFRLAPGGRVLVEDSALWSHALEGGARTRVGAPGWITEQLGDFYVASDGSVLAIHEGEQALVRLGASGELLAYWVAPPDQPVERLTAIEPMPGGRFVLADSGLGKLHVMTETFERLATLDWDLTGFAVTSRGRLVLLETTDAGYRVVGVDAELNRTEHGRLPRAPGESLVLHGITTAGLLVVMALKEDPADSRLRWMRRSGERVAQARCGALDPERPLRVSADGRVHVLTAGHAIVEVEAPR